MNTLKYKLIKNREQYFVYCKELEKLTDASSITSEMQDEIDLITFLIENWDKEHDVFHKLDPINLLKLLRKEHGLSISDLAKLANSNENTISDILNYKKGFSKEIIRSLAAHFKLSQEAFNRPYKLKLHLKIRVLGASLMNTVKEMELAH